MTICYFWASKFRKKSNNSLAKSCKPYVSHGRISHTSCQLQRILSLYRSTVKKHFKEISMRIFCHIFVVQHPKFFKSMSRGQILDRSWDKSLKFSPCYSLSPLQTDFTPPALLSKRRLKTDWQWKHCIRKPKSEDSQDCAQNPQGNWPFMNSASA